MASSKKTLDIDTLTFQTMYIKAQAGSQISSYTIPMIPSGDTILKELIFLTPQQALSVGNIYITTSTIPDIISTIGYLSTSQNEIIYAGSNISTLIGNTVSTTQYSTSIYAISTYKNIYNSTYSTLAGEYYVVEQQYISTLALNEIVLDITAATSTLSSMYISTFIALDNKLEITFNQGPSVSTMSTYLTEYFSSLDTNIPLYSTILCGSLSTTYEYSISSYSGYLSDTEYIITTAGGPGVSTLSTFIGSTFSSFEYTIASYNPSYGISSISTLVVSTLISFSTLFSDNSGIPGICSLSTTINLQSLSNIKNLPQIAGVPGLCTMSTVLTSSILFLNNEINKANNSMILSTFSTAIYTEIDVIQTQIFTIGYVNTILQQEVIKVSISTLSTSFGLNYNTMTSLSTYSTMLGPAYSTISTLFSIQDAYSTLYTVSTNQGSNISTLSYELYNTYPTIACGPGVSSLSSMLGTTISSMSTTLSPVYESLESTITTTTSSFTSTTMNLLENYSSISSILWQNIYSPQFSTFTASSISVSSITIQALTVSTMNVGQVLSVVGGMTVLPREVVGVKYVIVGPKAGAGENTIFTALSMPGTTQGGIANQFTGQGNAVAYNGSIWVAVGSNTENTGNLIKYSSTPSLQWTNATYPTIGMPSTFTTVEWNGPSGGWFAAGQSTILTSRDGATWSNTNPSIMISSIETMAWNGALGRWAIGGADPVLSSILYTDSNGVWNQGISTLSFKTNSITTNGSVWVAAGQGTTSMKYSYDGITWPDVTGPQLSTGTTVAWNGDKFVAGGSNRNTSNIVYSFDGVNWSYSAVPNVVSRATSILWDGAMWTVGSLEGSNYISADGIQWNNATNFTEMVPIYGQAYASNTIPSFQFSNFDIYSQETPVILNSRNRMTSIQSSIFFNDGGLTIRNVPSTIPYACIGINNTYPTVALDIGYGDARKVTGPYWISPSDARVKEDIVNADLSMCASTVASIPLRTFSFDTAFQKRTGVAPGSQYGFIAQEVKEVLPESIRYSDQYGFNDFHSIDADQIFKLEFGATQYLLKKVGELEAQIEALERAKKSLGSN
jgi:hypothetical protein